MDDDLFAVDSDFLAGIDFYDNLAYKNYNAVDTVFASVTAVDDKDIAGAAVEAAAVAVAAEGK